MRFSQIKAEQQLSKWYSLKMFSVCLKFVDYLQEYRMRLGGNSPKLYE